jgi:hypothetical protein
MTSQSSNTPVRNEAATYEIRLQGHLDARWASRLEVACLDHQDDGTTFMRAISADQSALHGLLQRIRDLGLPLISVTRLPPAPPSASPNEGF